MVEWFDFIFELSAFHLGIYYNSSFAFKIGQALKNLNLHLLFINYMSGVEGVLAYNSILSMFLPGNREPFSLFKGLKECIVFLLRKRGFLSPNWPAVLLSLLETGHLPPCWSSQNFLRNFSGHFSHSNDLRVPWLHSKLCKFH